PRRRKRRPGAVLLGARRANGRRSGRAHADVLRPRRTRLAGRRVADRRTDAAVPDGGTARARARRRRTPRPHSDRTESAVLAATARCLWPVARIAVSVR